MAFKLKRLERRGYSTTLKTINTKITLNLLGLTEYRRLQRLNVTGIIDLHTFNEYD